MSSGWTMWIKIVGSSLLTFFLVFHATRDSVAWKSTGDFIRGKQFPFLSDSSASDAEPVLTPVLENAANSTTRPKAQPQDPWIYTNSSLTRTLVMASTTKENTDWVSTELSEMIVKGALTPAIYVVDDEKAPLRTPINKGNEAMVYLTYIIDFYDHLADVTLFMHAHRWAMHNLDLLHTDAAPMIRRLSPERVVREGFMNMRCHWDTRCNDWAYGRKAKEESVGYVREAWALIFPEIPIPANLATPCCAQFAVSRDTLRAYPREYYVRIRDWLIHTPLNNYESGRFLEFTWQFVLSGKVVSCPTPDACYCDGYGLCFGSQDLLGEWMAMRRSRTEMLDELRKLREARKEWEHEHRDADLSTLRDEPGSLRSLEKELGLQASTDMIALEIDRRLDAAVELGREPRARALAAEREWQEGDGY